MPCPVPKNILVPLLGFLCFQFFEYFSHRLFHALKYQRHMEHHRNSKTEDWLYYSALGCLTWFKFYGVAVGLFWYLFVHRASHKMPDLIPALARHHNVHHRKPWTNFGVSSPFLDHIFRTKEA